MKSRHFEFLRERRPELAELGAFAGQYTESDPNGALVKMRRFIEQVVESIYDAKHLPKPDRANLNDLLNEHVFTEITPRVVLQKFHLVRLRGNKAVHGETFLGGYGWREHSWNQSVVYPI